jgi:branched-chain amino acid aminotransferase
VAERMFVKEEMYGADAAFFCGTAAEVIGLKSLDDHDFTMPWENTLCKQVQDAYKNIIIENKQVLANEISGIE